MYDYIIEGYNITIVNNEQNNIICKKVFDIDEKWLRIVAGIEEDDIVSLVHQIKRIRNKALGVSGLAETLCRDYYVEHPVNGKFLPLMHVIIELNDTQKWSREQIADWLDTLPKQPVMKMEL